MNSVKLVVLIACLTPALSQAVLIDFNSLGPVGDPPPTVITGGVSVSFSNLEVGEVGGVTNGFVVGIGVPQNNGVVVADQANFNGRFLTALGFGLAVFRSPGFVRTIEFDMAVTNVRMYIADIDVGEGITANAFDESDTLLSMLVFPLGQDGRVQFVDFGTLSGIRKVTLVGDDPVGIDNLSFEPVEIEIEIDIKPGSDPNSINCNNDNGVIPVAILTTETFDATTVDHTTVTFEEAGETHVNKKSGEPRRHEEDVDDDGDTDLVLHFRMRDTALHCGSTKGTLLGETFDGVAIEGADSVRMVGGTTVITVGEPIP